MEKIKQITVGEFIIKYGIDSLQGYPITFGNQEHKMCLSESDLRDHNRRIFNATHKKKGREYFDHYHLKGNYRFYAIRWDIELQSEVAHWVYKTDLVTDYNFYMKHILPSIQEQIIKYQVNRRTSAMHNETNREEIFVDQFANAEEAKKYAEFRAEKLSEQGYSGEITYQTKDSVWHFLKPFKTKIQ